jgi:hypothetical protein
MEGYTEIHLHSPQEIKQIQVGHDNKYLITHRLGQSYRPSKKFIVLPRRVF